MVLNRPTFCSTQIVGTTAGGTIRPARTRRLIGRVEPAGATLPDVGDHGAEEDQRGDADDGEDEAVDEGDDHQVVARGEGLLRCCRTARSAAAMRTAAGPTR